MSRIAALNVLLILSACSYDPDMSVLSAPDQGESNLIDPLPRTVSPTPDACASMSHNSRKVACPTAPAPPSFNFTDNCISSDTLDCQRQFVVIFATWSSLRIARGNVNDINILNDARRSLNNTNYAKIQDATQNVAELIIRMSSQDKLNELSDFAQGRSQASWGAAIRWGYLAYRAYKSARPGTPVRPTLPDIGVDWREWMLSLSSEDMDRALDEVNKTLFILENSEWMYSNPQTLESFQRATNNVRAMRRDLASLIQYRAQLAKWAESQRPPEPNVAKPPAPPVRTRDRQGGWQPDPNDRPERSRESATGGSKESTKEAKPEPTPVKEKAEPKPTPSKETPVPISGPR